MSAAPARLTDDRLLGGRLMYRQSAGGYRSGLEPVLLAASVPARPGERVLEAGCGAGAGLLCLAARIPGVTGVGLERDAALAKLADENFAANGMGALRAVQGDMTAWRDEAPFDHAFANPPWHDAAGTPSPLAARRAAKQSESGLLAAWVLGMARALRRRGTLSLIVPGTALVEAIAALAAANCWEVTVFPLWPRANAAAKLVILRGVRLGNGGARVLPGLVLHENGGFTEAATAVLRSGRAIEDPSPNPLPEVGERAFEGGGEVALPGS